MFSALTLAAACCALLIEASLQGNSACKRYTIVGQAGGWSGPSDCLLMPTQRCATAARQSWGTAVILQPQTLHIKEHWTLPGCTATLSLLLIAQDGRPKGGLPL